jgi:hypothetical protein
MHSIGAAVLIISFVLYLRRADGFAATIACAPLAVARVHLPRSVGREPPSVEVRKKPLPRVVRERHADVA